MRKYNLLLISVGLMVSPMALADVAKHTTVSTNASGKRTAYTEMVADDNGNLRIDIYGVDGSGNRAGLTDFVIFQAKEQKMLSSSGGTCQTMSYDGEDLPGGVSQAEMAAAQAEMQKALAEMRAQNPEMAKMLEKQMGSGMAAIMGGEQTPMKLEKTGDDRTIDGYDTTGFKVTGGPMAAANYSVWAADIDDVDGARVIGAASAGMMRANKQMMDNMGVGQVFGGNVFGEIMEKMADYYPVLTEAGGIRTKLISTDGAGSSDFYPACN
jgi:hypothetical protein